MNNTRTPAFASRFYPDSEPEITALIEKLVFAERNNIKPIQEHSSIIGGVVPHAGWAYSGYEAVHFYSAIQESGQTFDTVVIVNPNHSGYGNGPFNKGNWVSWQTPFGKIDIDKNFENQLNIDANNYAHLGEHSGEVQLPFMQYFFKFPFKLSVITMNHQTLENATILANKIYTAEKHTCNKVLLLASSDFSHYETPTECSRKDQLLIDKIINKDINGVVQVIKQSNISACGYGPIMVLMAYSNLKNNDFQIQLLRKGNSGDVYKSDKVVGYASLLSTEGNVFY